MFESSEFGGSAIESFLVHGSVERVILLEVVSEAKESLSVELDDSFARSLFLLICSEIALLLFGLLSVSHLVNVVKLVLCILSKLRNSRFTLM